MTGGTIVLACLIRPEELTRRTSLLLIPAIALIDIAKLLSLVGGLALTLTLGVYDAVARAGVGPCQAQGQGHQACNQCFCPHLFKISAETAAESCNPALFTVRQ